MADTPQPAVSPSADDSIVRAPASQTQAGSQEVDTTLGSSSLPATATDDAAAAWIEPTMLPPAASASPVHVPHDGSSASPPPIERTQTEALGPATDDALIGPAPVQGMPIILALTLQLTTGARHPYKIDQKYLANRKVEAVDGAGNFDPREISGYKLKELIWTDWRGEWEPRPASPSSIRLIYMGKLLEDKKALKDYNLTLENPSIVHMTIKPAEFDEDETAAKGAKTGSVRARDGEERDAGCRCVVL